MPALEDVQTGAPAGRMSVSALSDVGSLREHVADLEELSAAVAEPNVFYEPWMLIPAVEAFGAGREFAFVLVYAESPLQDVPPVLCGFFPFERRRRYARLPARLLLLWEYRHCGVCTPLIRQGYEKACLEALIDWAATDRNGADVIEWLQVSGDGPIFKALTQCVEERGLRRILATRKRPLMAPRESSEVFLNEALSSNRKRGLRRWERQLGEHGAVAYREAENGELDAWIDRFFEMEASGWKGRAGVAAIDDENTHRFIRQALQEASRRGQLLTLSMTVGGEPAATRFILTSGGGAFGYKISYHEKYARYSPGSLLEIESIRRVHQHSEIRWLDSCVTPRFSHYLPWLDELQIADVAFSTGSFKGNTALTVGPWLRALGKAITSKKESPRKGKAVDKSDQQKTDESPEK